VRVACVTAAIAIVAAAAACGGESPAGPGSSDSSPAGTYTISTVNAKPLPFTMFSDTNYLYEVTSGSFSLTTDGRYTRAMSFRQTIPGDVSLFVDSTGGSWVLNGATVTFTDGVDATVDSAAYSGGKLTFTESNGVVSSVYVYTRSK
jgi:hypothetical protein